jgi:hypothetical protein
MATNYFAKYEIAKYLTDPNTDLSATCADEIEMAIGADLVEDDHIGNKEMLDAWRDANPCATKKIDLDVERSAFGKDATPAGRLKAYKVYGSVLFDERRLAWGASEGVITSGSEPGKDDAATVKKAEAIIAADEEGGANSPFNPKKKYTSDEARLRDIGKYVTRFGTKSAQKACLRFGVDLAGRALQRRA